LIRRFGRDWHLHQLLAVVVGFVCLNKTIESFQWVDRPFELVSLPAVHESSSGSSTEKATPSVANDLGMPATAAFASSTLGKISAMSRRSVERSPFDPGCVTHLTTPNVETALMT
jgi:hypothetical protein